MHALFLAGLAWFNVQKPLTAQDLQGRVVLLDFWTYGCINCMHVMPDLKALEEKYKARGVVVIGVHSGKFDDEKDQENIRAAIMRNDLHHPVVDDSEYKVWEAFGVQAWPTLIVVGTNGEVALTVRGEGHRQELDDAIKQALDDGKKRGDLKDTPLALRTEQGEKKALAYPGKIIAGADRLYIADTNHNRVLEAQPNGEVVQRFEGGFLRPQGLALDGTTLYVADTGNHVVKAIDLRTKAVRTVAGTGEKGRPREGDALQSKLASPWDVLVLSGVLYVANAGTHQLVAVENGKLRVAAGSGREARVDGPAASAALAQPSGLATDGASVFFADSEASSVRRYDPKARTVETLVGKDLFDFGDEDGRFADARLQHCLGLAFDGGALYVTDTYNHKVKRLDLQARTVGTVFGDRKHAALYEPGGLAVLGGKLYVADTNHSRIVVYDPKTKVERELVLKGRDI
jgi:sugar lactone lactonase YvrE/peroxiredoxin